MINNITEYKKILSAEFDELFDATESALNEWVTQNSDGNLKFPSLLTTLAVKFNWDEKLMRENDPIIRKYIRKHPKWIITRGPSGGITPRDNWEKKNTAKSFKEIARQQAKEKLEAKIAELQNDVDTSPSLDE